MEDVVKKGILSSVAAAIGAPEQAFRLLVSILIGCIHNKFSHVIINLIIFHTQGIQLLSLIVTTSGTNLPLSNTFSLLSLESLLDFSTLVSFRNAELGSSFIRLSFTGWDIGHSFGCVLVQYLLIKILSGTRICVALSFVFHLTYLLLGKTGNKSFFF